MDATIRQLALTDADVELIQSALVYLKNMTEAIGHEAGGLIAGDEKIIEQLEVLIKQFEEM